METPKSARKPKPARNPTPRLSERKRSLFVDRYSTLAGNDVMEGIELLDASDSNAENKSVMTRSMRSIEASLQSNCSTSLSFLSDVSIGVKNSEYTSPLRRSPRNNVNKHSQGTLLKSIGGKENTLKYADIESADDQLQNMFNESMRITSRHYENVKAETQKRNIEQVKESTGMSPRRKTAKYSVNDKELSSISTKKFYSASRPGNSHSEVQKLVLSKNTSSPPTMIKNISPRSRGRFERRITGIVNINKGVKHKVRRPARPNISGGNYRKNLSSIEIDRILENLHNENLKNRIALKREERQNIEKIHKIFRSCKNPIEMARPLTVISGMDDTNNNLSDYVLSPSKKNQEFKTVDEIDADFSDIDSIFDEYEDLPTEEEIIPLISHQPASIEAALGESETEARTTQRKRKFFKSGRSNHTPKEIRITDNIKASICNGKLCLIPEEKKMKKKPKRRPSTTYDITDEQATVEEILKNLNDTAYGDIDVDIDNDTKNLSNSEQKENHTVESSVVQLDSDRDYSNFRKRLPYNTNDPLVVEQQHLLLDFLINNSMCTEENFTIFIADPDNHKEDAARIVDQVFVLVNEQDYYRQRIPYNTSDPEIEMQQHRMLDFLIENNMCTEENFDIFIANYNRRHKEADEIMATIRDQGNGISSISGLKNLVCDNMQPKKIITENNDSKNTTSNIEISQATAKAIEPSSGGTLLPLPTTHSGDDTGPTNYPIFSKQRWKPIQQQSTRNLARLWNLGRGTDQYQIDAGQTEFGAHQCKQCGLIYSIHEPEEEKLHHDYHASLSLLRFKGWIDEDIVAIYPEWGADGRILRITETSHSRRHERLADILKIVDKELGYASYVIPPIFVAYLAVRKFQIVGVCLVVPLEKANKFLKVNGMDCCTEEVYPAKCGISRIWVSPLHRRLHIASKLIHAVQQNTIFGEEIPLDKIAFSSPTENGRLFAQNATQMENFLVYQ